MLNHANSPLGGSTDSLAIREALGTTRSTASSVVSTSWNLISRGTVLERSMQSFNHSTLEYTSMTCQSVGVFVATSYQC